MEYVIIVLIVALAALVVGTPLYLLDRVKHGVERGGARAAMPDLAPLRVELEARYQAEAERLRGEARAAIAEIDAELGRLREGLRSSAHEHERQLVQLRERFGVVDEQSTRLIEQGLRDLRSYLDGEFGRLREGLGGAMAALAARQESGQGSQLQQRRVEAIGDLYRRLAKLEATVVAVTNPVLLPGEPYSLPAELLPETLRWENWKEVGDGAFAFADAFNQSRIYLDDQTCRDLAAFVAGLRELLTRSIYPNLQPRPNDETKRTLRAAIEQLGADIPAARERLERAFREEAGRE